MMMTILIIINILTPGADKYGASNGLPSLVIKYLEIHFRKLTPKKIVLINMLINSPPYISIYTWEIQSLSAFIAESVFSYYYFISGGSMGHVCIKSSDTLSKTQKMTWIGYPLGRGFASFLPGIKLHTYSPREAIQKLPQLRVFGFAAPHLRHLPLYLFTSTPILMCSFSRGMHCADGGP